jgi:hypothetical protein
LERFMRETKLTKRVASASLAALAAFQLVAVGRVAAAARPDHELALIIPPGTDVPVTLDENVAIKRDAIGNTYSAHVTRNVMVDGALAIPRSTPAQVALVENDEHPGAASFRLISLSIDGRMRPVRTDVARADADHAGLNTGQKTGIGAVAGGLLGLVTGGGHGLLRGAAVGAGGGLAWGLLDHGTQRVEHDTPLLFSLRDSIRVQ